MLLLISKYCIKNVNLSGLNVFLGIGTLNLNWSGEKPVSMAGCKDTSDISHSPDSILNCIIVSVFSILSSLKLGLNVVDTVLYSSSSTSSCLNCKPITSPFSFRISRPKLVSPS